MKFHVDGNAISFVLDKDESLVFVRCDLPETTKEGKLNVLMVNEGGGNFRMNTSLVTPDGDTSMVIFSPVNFTFLDLTSGKHGTEIMASKSGTLVTAVGILISNKDLLKYYALENKSVPISGENLIIVREIHEQR